MKATDSHQKNLAFYRGKRVFVTGHTGFKGAWLTAMLHELGAEATGYALAPEEGCLFEKINGGTMLRNVTGDVRDYERMRSVMLETRPEIVIHLAARVPAKDCFDHPRDTYETNVMGTVNLLEAVRLCPGIKSVVIVTTDKVYENKGDGAVYTENDPLGGNEPYSSSKTCTEFITNAYMQSYLQTEGLGVSTVRASNVLGGGDHVQSRLIPTILNAVAAGRPVALRNPNQTRPWQSVLDALNGYLAIARLMYLEPQEYSGVWNIGPGRDGIRTVLWVFDKLRSYYANAEYIVGETLDILESKTLGLDITKSLRELDWAPLVSCDKMLYNVVDFFRQQRSGVPEAEICAGQIRDFFEVKS